MSADHPLVVKALIEASGVAATAPLDSSTKVTASCGDSQRDGAYWRFVAKFDPTIDLITGVAR